MGSTRAAANCALVVAGLVVLTAGAAQARPWTPRAPGVEPKPAHALRTPATWPAEPEPPAPIDAAKFTAAYAHLCGVDAASSKAAVAGQLLTAAQAGKS